MQTESSNLAYLAKKIIWRNWIRGLSWLRRRHALHG
jgi:hypothetical protein